MWVNGLREDFETSRKEKSGVFQLETPRKFESSVVFKSEFANTSITALSDEYCLVAMYGLRTRLLDAPRGASRVNVHGVNYSRIKDKWLQV